MTQVLLFLDVMIWSEAAGGLSLESKFMGQIAAEGKRLAVYNIIIIIIIAKQKPK